MQNRTLQNLGRVVVLLTFACSTGDTADTPGEDEAATSPPAQPMGTGAVAAQDLGVEVVAPGVISTDQHQTFPAQDPTDGSLWFSVYEVGFDAQTIMVATRTESGFNTPVVAPFSGTYGDRAPRFSPDGQFLYFTSNRPRSASAASDDMNIWRVRRVNNTWSDPELLGEPLNSQSRDIHVAATNAALWVASDRPGGMGRSDIYRVPLNGGTLGEAAHLPAPINDENSQPDIWVSPDETWMILVITEHPNGLGGDDLFISRFEDGTWTAPHNLGAGINSDEYEYGPTMSQDGEYIHFTSHRSGSADVYRVPVSAVLTQTGS